NLESWLAQVGFKTARSFNNFCGQVCAERGVRLQVCDNGLGNFLWVRSCWHAEIEHGFCRCGNRINRLVHGRGSKTGYGDRWTRPNQVPGISILVPGNLRALKQTRILAEILGRVRATFQFGLS